MSLPFQTDSFSRDSTTVPLELKERLVDQLKNAVGLLNNFRTVVEGREISRRFRVSDTDPNVVDDSFFSIVNEIRAVLDKLEEHCEKLRRPAQETVESVPEEGEVAAGATQVELRRNPNAPAAAPVRSDSGYVGSQEVRVSTLEQTEKLAGLSMTTPKTVKEEEEAEPKIPCEVSDEDIPEARDDSSDL